MYGLTQFNSMYLYHIDVSASEVHDDEEDINESELNPLVMSIHIRTFILAFL